MRHKLNQPFHRNTRRNRRIADGREFKPGAIKKGRKVSEELVAGSFLLFAGACIETWNQEREDGGRRCTYYEIFNKEKTVPVGQPFPYYRYPKVSTKLFNKLVDSNFPPQLLAVATADVIPLNKLTKGERFSSSKNTFDAKVKELAAKPDGKWLDSATDILDAHFRGDTLGKTVSASSLSRAGNDSREILENIPDESDSDFYAAMDERLGLVEPNERPQPENPIEWNPKNIISGTKVHHIDFHVGLKISRRMACYWRKNRADEYKRCCDFIRSLLKKPWPRAPSLEEMASTAPLFNALLQKDMERMHKAAKIRDDKLKSGDKS